MGAFPLSRIALLSLVASPWQKPAGRSPVRKRFPKMSSYGLDSSQGMMSTLRLRSIQANNAYLQEAKRVPRKRSKLRRSCKTQASIRRCSVEADFLARWHEGKKVSRIFAQNRIC